MILDKLKDQAFLEELGIVDWSYTNQLEPVSFERYDKWVKREDHGALHYLGDHRREARRSLNSVLPDCKSALIFLFTYHPQKRALEEVYKNDHWNGLKLGSYVLGFNGVDYHYEVKSRLSRIGDALKESVENLEYTHALDVHPVLERDLAFRSGLGWFGKNSMMISKEYGSYTILGTLLLNKELNLEGKKREVDHCGKCRACVDACPTDAIDIEARSIKANLCISTFTIELFKDAPAPKGMEQSNGEFFGCDICQEVCPWNKRPLRLDRVEAAESGAFLKQNELIINKFLLRPIDEIEEDLEATSNNKFAKNYKFTPLGRTGRKGLLKNIKFWKSVKKS